MNKIVLGVVVVAILVVGFFVIVQPFVINERCEHSFIINQSFKQVVFKLAKQDVLENIISANNGMIIGRKQSTALHIDKIMKPEWHIEGHGIFVVKFNNPFKTIVLKLQQHIIADKNRMETTLYKIESDAIVKTYQSYTKIEPLGDKQTKITICNFTVIEMRIPKSYQDEMKQKVHEQNMRGIENAETCIRTACDASLFTIPVFKREN